MPSTPRGYGVPAYGAPPEEDYGPPPAPPGPPYGAGSGSPYGQAPGGPYAERPDQGGYGGGYSDGGYGGGGYGGGGYGAHHGEPEEPRHGGGYDPRAGGYPSAGASGAPIADMLKVLGDRMLGHTGTTLALIMAVTVLLALIGTTLACLNTGVRITYVMGRDKEMPGVLGLLHGKYATPHGGVWVLTAVSALFGIYGVKSVNTLTQITLASNTGTFIVYGLTCIVCLVAFASTRPSGDACTPAPHSTVRAAMRSVPPFVLTVTASGWMSVTGDPSMS